MASALAGLCAQPAAMAATNKCLARSNKSRTRGNAKLLVGNLFDPISVFHETLRPRSCSHARARRVGLACRARLRVVHIVLAKARRNRLGMSLPGMRLQRRARLARSKWSVRVTR